MIHWQISHELKILISSQATSRLQHLLYFQFGGDNCSLLTEVNVRHTDLMELNEARKFCPFYLSRPSLFGLGYISSRCQNWIDLHSSLMPHCCHSKRNLKSVGKTFKPLYTTTSLPVSPNELSRTPQNMVHTNTFERLWFVILKVVIRAEF